VFAPVLFLAALRLTLAGSVALLLNLEMVATAVLGAALFREHLGRLGWLGVSGVVAAGGLVAGGGGWPGLVAALLMAAACACWGLDNNLTALIDGVTPARATLVKGAVAGTVNLAIGCAIAPLNAGPIVLAAGIAVGALSYGASIALYIAAAHELGATRAQAVFASSPFVGAALAFAVVGEPFGTAHLAACLLLVPSRRAVLSQHASRARARGARARAQPPARRRPPPPRASRGVVGAAPQPLPPTRAPSPRASALARSPPPALAPDGARIAWPGEDRSPRES
jgi:hypothetical protein